MREIAKLVVVLALICGISATILTVARQNLALKIEQQSDFYVRGPALERLFSKPASELLSNKISISAGDNSYPVFYLMDEGKITGLAIEASGTGGYGGNIVIMIGVDIQTNQIVGMEIIQHSETPGVGSKVEKSSFRKQWKGLIINESMKLTSQGGQIDAISGATYSSKAVVNGTNQIVGLVNDHRDEIMSLIKANSK
ncbi:MAG: FMN-binding protein [candidate division Zixibacteria bacterium]|nr:FMN-binding protein [candidate division Zixibacteria bacterium]